MRKIKGMQKCFKCKGQKNIDEFYEKGNRFINCSECRSERTSKKLAIQMLLRKDKELNGHRVV